jgi:hypothetical protein
MWDGWSNDICPTWQPVRLGQSTRRSSAILSVALFTAQVDGATLLYYIRI